MKKDTKEKQPTGLRVVLDTNVYVSALNFPNSPLTDLVEHAQRGTYQLIISPAIVGEVADVLRRFEWTERDIRVRLKTITKSSEIVMPQTVPDVIKDSKLRNSLFVFPHATIQKAAAPFGTAAFLMTDIFQKLKYIVAHITQKLNLFPQAKKEGRPLAIKETDALTFALYKHKSTRATKKSVYDDFGLESVCSYKTFVVSVKRMGIYALRIFFFLMRLGRKDAHFIKFTDSTDLPVCLNKNAVKHKTMKGLAAWGHSGKGFYYGLKMTMTRDDDGRLLALSFSPANANDRKIFRTINKNIEGIIIADAGYVSKELEREMTTDKRILLIKPLKNMKKIATAWQLALYNRRFKIEFDFRNLKLFHGLVSSLPRSVDGYIGNYLFALLSYVIV